jgi:uncharacterized protein YcbX
VWENRRFFLVDAHARMVNGKRHGSLQTIVASYSHVRDTLALEFPDGRRVEGAVVLGAPLESRFFSSTVPARVVEGPWAAALSAHVGEPVTLVQSELPAGGVDRGARGAVSLISRATLARIAAAAGVQGSLDGRRFRMLFEVEGVAAHAEDAWLGVPLRVGEVVVTLRGHVGRCAVTTRDPDSGLRDLDTLEALARYRREIDTTEPLACGVYGSVLTPGTVRIGDPVELLNV